MSDTEKQSLPGGFLPFPRLDNGTLAPLHPVFPESTYQNMLAVLRGNLEQAMDRGDVKAVLGYSVVLTGLTDAIAAIKDAYDAMDGWKSVLAATEQSLGERLEEQRQAAQARQP